MGRVEGICIGQSAGAAMHSVSEAQAIPGVGLVGDRYAGHVGTYSERPTADGAREVTLFEAEALDYLRAEHGIELAATDHRRNVTVRGVRLAELIGSRLQVGEVVLEGVLDCPPCEHLQALLGKPVLRPLVGRGGLRARILQGGTLRVGDPVSVLAPAAL